MSHQDLIKALLQDGRRQSKQIIEKAKGEAEEILKNAKKESEQLKKEALKKIEADVKIESIEIVNRAKITSEGKALKAKYEIMENIFQDAAKRFSEIKTSKEHLAVFEKLCKEILGDIKGDARIIIDKEDVGLFKKLFPDINIKIEPFHGNTKITGIELVAQNGAVIIKNTLTSRLEKIKPEIMPELNNLLFGKA